MFPATAGPWAGTSSTSPCAPCPCAARSPCAAPLLFLQACACPTRGTGATILARGEAASRRRCSCPQRTGDDRSEEHTSELQSLMRISYAVFCLKKKKETSHITIQQEQKTSTIT